MKKNRNTICDLKRGTGMKKLRDSWKALCVIAILTLSSEHGGILCLRHGHRRTHPSKRPFKGLDGSSQYPSRSGLARLPSLTENCKERPARFSFGLMEYGWDSGGFGDRVRGMVTTYYLALMSNSSFSVDWAKPYNLSDYFTVPSCIVHPGDKQPGDKQPGDKQRDLPSASSSKNEPVGASSSKPPDSDKIVRLDHNRYKYFNESMFIPDIGKNIEVHTNAYHWKQVVRNKIFRERALSLGLLGLSQAELFKLAVDELFGNPTSVVRESFESLMRQLAGGQDDKRNFPYVGVQIRVGGKNGNPVSGWNDPSRHSLSDVPCFAAEAVRLCHFLHAKSIFVTADSEDAVRVFEDAVARESASACWSCPPPIVVQVPGSIAHTDLSRVAKEHSKDVWLKSIMDWWMLKHASALVISRSGFGETAAMASGAKTAPRLKLVPATNATSKAGESNKCEFEDVLMHDRDVIS